MLARHAPPLGWLAGCGMSNQHCCVCLLLQVYPALDPSTPIYAPAFPMQLVRRRLQVCSWLACAAVEQACNSCAGVAGSWTVLGWRLGFPFAAAVVGTCTTAVVLTAGSTTMIEPP